MQPVFNPAQDAQIIKASFVKPRKLDQLIEIITHRSNEQRQEILKIYNNQNEIPLQNEIQSNLSGDFKEAVLALFYPPVDYDCYLINKAVEGFGTNEETLIEIISSRSIERLNEIKQRYPQMYQKEIKDVIKSETSGHLQKILLSLLETDRSLNKTPNPQECDESAKRLYFSQEGKRDMAYNSFIYVFTKKSREELALISKIYYQTYHKTLLESIKNIFSGDGRSVLKAIIYSLLSPSEYFAYRINKALKGFFVNDNKIIRILISRDEIDIELIKRYYKQLYGNSLYDDLLNKTSGDLRNLLLSLVGK